MKFLKVLTATSVVAALALVVYLNQQPSEREQYALYLENHPYNNLGLTDQEVEDMPKKDRPDLAFMQDFLLTMDPKLKRPTKEVLYPVLAELNKQNNIYSSSKTATINWVERGPTNVGGRTRALIFDPNDTAGTKVWAGGVGGGLWYNDDITTFSSSWQNVDDFWANMAISAMAYDPTNTQVFYVGTGEGYGNIDAARGNGIWKTTDGGVTWNQLASTNNTATFTYVMHLAVHPITGDVYASTRTGGLQRSTDGGVTWTKVLGSGVGANSNRINKVEFNENGTVWVAVHAAGVYRSYTGDANSFNKMNTTGNGFSPSPSARVELALAPSDTNVVYVMSVTGTPRLFRSTDAGATWSALALPDDADFGIPANDFTRGQSWYDYTIAVNPLDKDHAVVGGVDLFQTIDGGATWDQLSHWYGGFSYQYVHADQHNIVFRNDSSGVAIFSHDGGISYCPDMGTASPIIVTRIQDYNTTQFYACAAHPAAGSNYFLAGAQDNGTQQFVLPGAGATTEATGGDGGFCYIDQDNPNWQLTAYTRNNHSFSADGGISWGGLQSSENSGSFINPGDYHDALNILFTAKSSSSIKRTFINGNLNPNTDDLPVSMSGGTTHIKASPYSTSTATLFVGTSSGGVYKVTGADGLSPSTTNIGSNSFPTGSVTCIAVGQSENELVVTFGNYGVNSVWYTNDGGINWNSIEGNLPNMPVRWALFNPNDFNEVILATELGVWECLDIHAATPSWAAANNGLANVRVSMLQLRASDGTVAASTHARGLFTSDVFANPNPTANIGEHREILCANEEVAFENFSFNATSYQWNISPSTFNFVNGTSATSKDPEIEFTANGNYSIELIAFNANGSDTAYSTTSVGSLPLPFNEDFSNNSLNRRWKIVNIDGDLTWENRQVMGGTSVSVQNFGYVGASILGQADDLITPPLDFTGADYPVLNFNYSYTSRTTQADSLGIFVSDDCGETWTHLLTLSEDGTGSYFTTNPRNFSFTPTTQSQWCGNGNNAPCGFVDLSWYAANKDNVRVMFRNYSHMGNNVYIGDVNITNSSIGIPERSVQSLKIYPNPALDRTTLLLNSSETGTANIQVFDITGKLVLDNKVEVVSSNKIELSTERLTPGTYVVKVELNNKTYTENLLKQ